LPRKNAKGSYILLYLVSSDYAAQTEFFLIEFAFPDEAKTKPSVAVASLFTGVLPYKLGQWKHFFTKHNFLFFS
jgi:hypothetical protein